MYLRSACGKILHLTLFTVLAFLFLAFHDAAPALAQTGPPGGLPEQASAQAEAQFEGELEVLYECDEDTGRLKHVLKLENGRRMNLEFAGGVAPDLPTGSRIRARGRLRDETTLMLADAGSVQALSAAAGATTFGERRLIVVLVNFQDNASQPFSVATAKAVAFDQVSRFVQESSYGQTSVAGDAFGWFTLPMSSATCDVGMISSLANQALADAGVNLSSYTHRMYAFPSIGSCGWRGLGSVGGSPSVAFINGGFAVRTVAHELGHNLGLHHSKSRPCTSGSCSAVEYGDDHDVMGKSGVVAHTNTFQKERLGWLNYSAAPAIQTVTQSGNYWIDGYAPAGAASKALKVLKSADSTSGKTYYYFEARVKYGFDGSAVPGVVVHTGSDANGDSSFQVDLDPVTTTFDSILDADQTFTDAALGLSVKTLWADASGAMVDVTYSGPPCTAVAPTVTFTPSSTLWIQAGKSGAVTMTVKNNDGSGCNAAVFALSSSVPTGWTATLDRPSLTLEPGASGSAGLVLTPAPGATGNFGFAAAAKRSGAAGAQANGSAVVVDGLLVTVAAGSAGRSGYTLTAKVMAGGRSVAGANVTFTLVSPNLSTVWLGALTDAYGVASAKWRPRKTDVPGTYQVKAEASASGLTGTGSATFTR
jgi:hypothetical protein